MTAIVTIEAVVIALLALLVAGLLRSHAEILRALHDLGAGIDPDAPNPTRTTLPGIDRTGPRSGETAASDVVGVTTTGEAVAVGVAGSAQHTLLAFLSSGCHTCAGFWDAFAHLDPSTVPAGARLVVVTKGPDQESPGQVGELAPKGITVVMSSDAWEAYGVPVTPYFVFVDGPSATVVGEGAAGTWEHVSNLMGQALADTGVTTAGPATPRPPAKDNAARIDADLLSAGIYPGHPSLYPQPVVDEPAGDER